MDEEVSLIGILVFLVLVGLGGCYIYRNTYTCMERDYFVGKRFVPAHTRSWVEDHCVTSDAKTGVCTFSVPVQHSEFVPDAWFLMWGDRDGAPSEDQVDQGTFEHHEDWMLRPHVRWGGCR